MPTLISPEKLSEAAFRPFGAVISAIRDDSPYGSDDACLELDAGTPRFYIMRLQHRPPVIHELARHRLVTQVLASAENRPWLIAVCEPTENQSEQGKPDFEAVRAFAVPGNVAIKLHRGTWHAGPYFEDEQACFHNLELSDTNINDHHSWRPEDFLGHRPELLMSRPWPL